MDAFAQGRNKTSLPPSVTKLEWRTKLVDLLPDDWKLMDEWADKHANLRDILAHVSGVVK